MKPYLIISLKIQKRHLIMANRYKLSPSEKPEIIDYIGFLVSTIVPLILPLALLENVV
jgi:hypothetical protein